MEVGCEINISALGRLFRPRSRPHTAFLPISRKVIFFRIRSLIARSNISINIVTIINMSVANACSENGLIFNIRSQKNDRPQHQDHHDQDHHHQDQHHQDHHPLCGGIIGEEVTVRARDHEPLSDCWLSSGICLARFGLRGLGLIWFTFYLMSWFGKKMAH